MELFTKDVPSEYVQSVAGHGRQHDTFPTSVGVGRQRRPRMTGHVSCLAVTGHAKPKGALKQRTSAFHGKLRLLEEWPRTISLERHCEYRTRRLEVRTGVLCASKLISPAHVLPLSVLRKAIAVRQIPKPFAVMATWCKHTAVRCGRAVACRSTSESQCRGGEDRRTRRRDRGIEGQYERRQAGT